MTAHIKVYPAGTDGAPSRTSFGTRVSVILDNGEEHFLKGVTSVNLKFPLDDFVVAQISILDFELENEPEGIQAKLETVIVDYTG